MREIYDENSGAILFKREDESNPTDKRIKILEDKVSRQDAIIKKLCQDLDDLKLLVIALTN